MKITNRQFINTYLQDLPLREILAVLSVIRTLLVRKKILLVQRLDPADEQVKSLQALISILEENKKLNRTDISALVRMLEQTSADDSKHFTLISNNQSLKNAVGKAVDGELDAEESPQIGVTLQGEGRIYKRTLSSDLNKLLK